MSVIKLHDLKPAPGSKKAKTRVGRGEASKGKTAGRGTKGTKARKNVPVTFEGGQMPIHMRLPKLKGFRNRFRTEYAVVNVGDIARVFPEGGSVGVEELIAKVVGFRSMVLQEAERLSHLGPPQEMAWLAFADLPDQPDAPVGGVRYVMTASDTAELAISVRDDLQRRGIGSALLVFACQQARRQGLHYLTAVFRSENKAVWSLVRHSPFHTTSVINGSEISLRIDLTDRAG